MTRLEHTGPAPRERASRFDERQQDAALRYADAAERNLRKLRKALKKGRVSNSAEWLAALQSDAARVATVLAFIEPKTEKHPAREPD
jgi:hypothetical protein